MPQEVVSACECAALEELGVHREQPAGMGAMERPGMVEEPEEKILVHIVALKHGHADMVAKMVERSLTRRRTDMRLVPDVRTNSVIISGSEEEVSAAAALIQALDSPDAHQQQD